MYIYILKCKNNKYYVGKTSNIDTRLLDHGNNNGSSWTIIHKPIDVLELIKSDDPYDEDKYVIKYMDKYGIVNVRGGSYSKFKLPKSTILDLIKQIAHASDKCMKCLQKGHYMSDCKNNWYYEAEDCGLAVDCGLVKDSSLDTNKHRNKSLGLCVSRVKSGKNMGRKCTNKAKYPLKNPLFCGRHDKYKKTRKTRNTTSDITCFKCGKKGHYANNCEPVKS